MSWPKTGANYYHAQLGLPDKDRAIKELVVTNHNTPGVLTKKRYSALIGYPRLLDHTLGSWTVTDQPPPPPPRKRLSHSYT